VTGEFKETGWCAYRNVERIAFLPTRTLDAGIVWGRRYWMHERLSGWGSHDRFRYGNGIPEDMKNMERVGWPIVGRSEQDVARPRAH
jgi:hypothetical protein